jgi:pilus assembly protein CpaC
MNGKEAEFLAGGSFPIPVAGGASTGGTSNVTIEFKEFGVKLRMTPVVLGDGRIRMRVTPEVSDLDFTTAVRFDGFTVPGLSQRRVDTTIELAEGQTFAIAGLLNNTVSATKDVTPVLGDVPVLGALFRSVRYQRKETELIVLVTPRLVEPMNPGQVPQLPGEKWRHPNESDLFLKQDLGGPIKPAAKATASAEPPRFYGSYGFNAARTPAKDAAAAAPAE